MTPGALADMDAGGRSLMGALRGDFAAAVEQRAAEGEGHARFAAALAGSVEYRTLADGRLEVSYRAARAGRRAEVKTDCIQNLPVSPRGHAGTHL